MLKQYEKKLKEKNIRCDLRINEYSFSLIMYYHDGGHFGVTFGRDLHSDSESYSFSNHFTGDQGKDYTSTSGSLITQDNWSEENVKNRIETTINDFLSYAERHGGY